MEFAISLWNLDPSPVTVASLRAQGVTAAEFGPPFLLQDDESAFLSTVHCYHEAGIRFYACHAPFGEESDLSQPSEGGRRHAVAIHKAGLERAAQAGVSAMVIHPSRRCPEHELARRTKQLYESLETLLPVAESTGVRLALENMLPAHIGSQSDDLLHFVDRYSSPYLGVCFDTGHAHVADDQGRVEGVATAFSRLRDRTIAFHLADNSGHHDQHSQPPYGSIEWESFVPALQEMGYAFPATVEAAPWNRAAPGTLLREIQALFAGEWPTYVLAGRETHPICQRCRHYLFGAAEAPFCACDRENR
jgi:sugar phosphate isomerase/epimerase